jgi:hypothetical protein
MTLKYLSRHTFANLNANVHKKLRLVGNSTPSASSELTIDN